MNYASPKEPCVCKTDARCLERGKIGTKKSMGNWLSQTLVNKSASSNREILEAIRIRMGLFYRI